MKNTHINLTILGILLIFLGIASNNLSEILLTNDNVYNNNETNLKSSGYSDKTNLDNENLKILKISGKIHIDNNWSDARAVGICTGNGAYSDPYIIEDLVIDGKNSSSCILIEYSDDYFKIENCTLYNSSSYTHDAGIKLNYVSNGILINNFITENGWDCRRTFGIFINSCDNITLFNNTISKNGRGINLLGSNISLTQNRISHNSEDGIYLVITNSTVLNNVIFNNSDYGIGLYGSDNVVLNNTISNNYYGVYLAYANNNTISMNIIYNNNEYDMGVLYNSNNNSIFNNYFISNSPNALDDGSSNQWDNGNIGNYWGDYGGEDANNDGIGDTPHSIGGLAGSQDNYPIWWDLVAISINSPNSNDFYGTAAPSFAITIDKGLAHTTWYTIDNGLTNITFTGLTGTINQALWDALSEGNVTIRFCANNTLGRIGFQEVTVVKTIFQSNPPEIPGYNILLLLGVVSTIAVIIVKKRLNHLN